jgi:hypothetical protein
MVMAAGAVASRDGKRGSWPLTVDVKRVIDGEVYGAEKVL